VLLHTGLAGREVHGYPLQLAGPEEEVYQRDLEDQDSPDPPSRLARKTLVEDPKLYHTLTENTYYQSQSSSNNLIYSPNLRDISDPDQRIYPTRVKSDSYNSEDYESNHHADIETNMDNPHKHRTQMIRTSQGGTKSLPQAIIIGVKKGGTRALLEFLRVHPDVRAPGPEPHFFDRHYHRGIEWYRNQMPSTLAGQITIEKTPSYFVTKGVPGRIYNMSKDTRLIVVVRNPVTRAISDYTQSLTKHAGMKSFEEMAFLDNSTGLVDTSWGAIRIGVYAKHLERWLKYFPLSQIHFVNGEKLIRDPASEMSKVQDFLGLKRVVSDKHFYFNTSKGFPCLKKPENSGNPHCLGKSKGRTHPDVSPKVLKRLSDFFRPFNQKFYQMTNQDFGWN